MSMNEGTTEKLRKFLLPGAASLLGAGAGLALTRTNKLRDALPSLDGVGIGDLADDLRSKLSSVSGKDGSEGTQSGSRSRRILDSGELEERRSRREERRKQRAGR